MTTTLVDAATAAYEETKVLGGFTYPQAPDKGYMVSISAANGGVPLIIPADDFKPVDVEEYIVQASIWLEHKDGYIGGWHNTEDGNVYLDYSRHFTDRKTAIAFAKLNDQIAIWDLAKSEEISTGGTGRS